MGHGAATMDSAPQTLLEQKSREIAHAATFVVRAILKDLIQMMGHRDTQALG